MASSGSLTDYDPSKSSNVSIWLSTRDRYIGLNWKSGSRNEPCQVFHVHAKEQGD